MMISYPILDHLEDSSAIKRLSMKELYDLAEEVRLRINEVVMETGGHLGPNLGTVEVIIACHVVFNLHKDRLIFDVGHQAYPHKILTQRHPYFKTLRQQGGISGYPHQDESPYDVFRGGHASTAISTSLGMLQGWEYHPDTCHRWVVALVGDGSLTGGMAFEGLNHTGFLKKRLIVILNDNTMSISPTIGALSTALKHMRHQSITAHLKKECTRLLKKIPKLGGKMEDLAQAFLDELTGLIHPKQLFTTLGFHYIGPVKGHDTEALIKSLKQAKQLQSPVMVHVLTEKGKGYYPDGPHGKIIYGPHALSPQKKKAPKTNHSNEVIQAPYTVPRPQKTYSKCFAESLIELAQTNAKIVAITAAMSEGTGLMQFENIFPKRFFDVGICEAHATGFAAGLAASGMRPVFGVYSTFLQRAFDQIFHEIVLQTHIPVLFCIDRAGLVGDDGPSHHGMYDIAYLRLYPAMVLMAPKDGHELKQMMAFALTLDGPAAIRYPKDAVPQNVFLTPPPSPICLGKAEVLTTGKSICILAYGSMVATAIKTAEMLEDNNIFATVINARFAKPLDAKVIPQATLDHDHVFVLEEGTLRGGFGSAVLELLNEKGLDTRHVHLLGCPDTLIEHASRKQQLETCRLDSKSLVRYIHDCVQGSTSLKKLYPPQSHV